MKLVEIYGTLGPACADEQTLTDMFRAGMTGVRLNLSHTTLRESGDLLEIYQRAAGKAKKEAQLLIDLQGPELRIGKLEHSMDLRSGKTVTLGELIPVPQRLLDALELGDYVLIDDGKMELEVTGLESADPDAEVGGNYLAEARVLRPGILTSRKSIKIIGKEVTGPVITDADRDNLRDARSFGVTAVMQPFVRSGRELAELRQELESCGAGNLRIFAKIEDMQGVEHLDEIIPEADMIVIARGDLGNDMPLWQLPRIQKEISDRCRAAGKPFLVVTQMLDSMVRNPIPTRAEVSDVFHAVTDGASAVMVTGETAAGEYPVEVMGYLANTVREACAYRDVRENVFTEGER